MNDADEAKPGPDLGLPTAMACGPYDRAVRPSDMLIMCGDGTEGLTGIRWRSWTAQGAAGSGTHFQRVCEPSCAEGRDINTPVTIRLSGPVTTGNGPAFSMMTVTGQRVHTIPLLTQ